VTNLRIVYGMEEFHEWVRLARAIFASVILDILDVEPDVLGEYELIDDSCFDRFFRNSGIYRILQCRYV